MKNQVKKSEVQAPNQNEQTKKQALAKCEDMLKEHQATALKECERLINSGALPFGNYENTFELPKCIVTVCLENEALQYQPHSDDLKKITKNLRRF